MTQKIAVIDYGMGNLRSVEKAFEKLGFPVEITGDPQKILEAPGAVLPGVGAFKDAMDHLRASGLDEAIKTLVDNDKPFLGICLGLELLFESSLEGGYAEGLGLVQGKVLPFPSGELRVPHMGWNKAVFNWPQYGDKLMDGMAPEPYFYFVHSYYCAAEESEDVFATTEYGIKFASAIKKGNTYAFQFHPEKSSTVGLKLIKNFGDICIQKV